MKVEWSVLRLVNSGTGQNNSALLMLSHPFKIKGFFQKKRRRKMRGRRKMRRKRKRGRRRKRREAFCSGPQNFLP